MYTGREALPSAGPVVMDDQEFRQFQRLIHARSGIALKPVKRHLLVARLTRRLRELGLSSFSDYYRLLSSERDDSAELLAMINAVTTNKTSFFRERHHFDSLARLAQQAASDPAHPRRFRVWSAACSTGEEPYSIAITLAETLGRHWEIRVLASDIDTDVLRHAALGIYPEDSLREVGADLRRRYFLRGTGQNTGLSCVKPGLKELVHFERVNLVDCCWGIGGQFDAIFCRNVIIYFDRPTQQTLFERMKGHLHPDGLLFIGHSESLQWIVDGFQPVGPTTYRFSCPPRGL